MVNNTVLWDTWLSQSEKHATPDVRVVGSRPTLGIEITKKYKLKKKYCFLYLKFAKKVDLLYSQHTHTQRLTVRGGGYVNLFGFTMYTISKHQVVSGWVVQPPQTTPLWPTKAGWHTQPKQRISLECLAPVAKAN